MLLADGTRTVTQPIIDLSDEGKSVLGTGKGPVGDEEEQIAVRNYHAVAVKEHLAEPAPFQVVLDFLGDEAEAALVLLHGDRGVERGAILHLGNSHPSEEIGDAEGNCSDNNE